jgi:hypothetical protein
LLEGKRDRLAGQVVCVYGSPSTGLESKENLTVGSNCTSNRLPWVSAA